jgi:hypothetical protein
MLGADLGMSADEISEAKGCGGYLAENNSSQVALATIQPAD